MRRHIRAAPSGASHAHAARRGRPLAALAVTALTAAALVAILSAGQDTASSKASGTLKLVLEVNRFADARADLDPPGDQVFNDDPVFDARNRKLVGHALTVRSFQEGNRALVTGALRLRDGTITLAGVLVNGAQDIAVTGGTRKYAGASGTYSEGTKPIAPIVEDRPGRYALTIRFAP